VALLQLSIEASVLDGFGDVVGLDVLLVDEVGDGAGDSQDLVVGAGAEAQLGDGLLEHGLAAGR